MTRRFRSLHADQRGVTVVEFAMVAPVLMFFIAGLLEVGYVSFARSTLESSILAASRSSRVSDCPKENAKQLEEQLIERMSAIVSADGQPPQLTIEAYGQEFGDVDNPEPFSDDNNNGTRDPGESYTDVNGNSQWDEDMGQDGDYGSFGEVVQFSASFNVPSLLPFVANRINEGKDFYTIEAVTVVRNEPFREVTCALT